MLFHLFVLTYQVKGQAEKMLLFIGLFLIGYGYYLITHIPPDTTEEVKVLMAMAAKVSILIGCAKLALFALLFKTRSRHLTLMDRIKSRFSKYNVPKRIRR
jgi:uncharacterized membrane protein